MPARAGHTAIIVDAIGILLPLLRVELDDVIPPARTVLAQDQSLRRGAGSVEVEPISGDLPGAQESQTYNWRRLALHLNLCRPFTVLRAAVAQVFGVVVMVTTLRGNFLPVKLSGLAQRAFHVGAGNLSFHLIDAGRRRKREQKHNKRK
jgi:hypothetical protein